MNSVLGFGFVFGVLGVCPSLHRTPVLLSSAWYWGCAPPLFCRSPAADADQASLLYSHSKSSSEVRSIVFEFDSPSMAELLLELIGTPVAIEAAGVPVNEDNEIIECTEVIPGPFVAVVAEAFFEKKP